MWPSIHPDMGVDAAVAIYLWYLAGKKPDGSGLGAEGIPYAHASVSSGSVGGLSHQRGCYWRMEQRGDLTSRKGEIYEWADKTFPDGSAEAMCSAIQTAKRRMD